MKKILCACLILLMLCIYTACAAPSEQPSKPITTAAAQTESPDGDSLSPSYLSTDTHFFALTKQNLNDFSALALNYVALDDPNSIHRVPLPNFYDNQWLTDARIDGLDGRWITLLAKTEAIYVRLRVALDTNAFEVLGIGETPPQSPQAAQPVMPPEDIRARMTADYIPTYMNSYSLVDRPEYECTSTYAKTPTHVFAWHDGVLYRLPLDDITVQTPVPLPAEYDELVICGITSEWLFVSGGTKNEAGTLDKATTYRIALGDLKAEQVDDCVTAGFPRYHPEGNALLYIRERTIEAFRLNNGARNIVFNFEDYYKAEDPNSVLKGWYTAPDGSAVLQLTTGAGAGFTTCIKFGEKNTAQVTDIMEIPFIKTQESHTPSKAEEELSQRLNPNAYADFRDAVYYLEQNSLYRVNYDNSNKKELAKDAGILSLLRVDGHLFCMVEVESVAGGGATNRYDFCELDENGTVLRTIAQGNADETGQVGYEPFGKLLMIKRYSTNRSESSLQWIYDPATTNQFLSNVD